MRKTKLQYYKTRSAAKTQYISLRCISTGMKLLNETISPSGKTHSASVIFFHGMGDTGQGILEWVRDLLGRDMRFSNIKIVYPTAPFQPYTPLNGEKTYVWFDRDDVNIGSAENGKSLAKIYETVHKLIDKQKKLGIAVNRIIVGGFSMGGALALHTAYHLYPNVAGVFACSAFLNRDSIVYDSLKKHNKDGTKLPELKMFNGQKDDVVPFEWGQETFRELTKMGVKGQFSSLSNVEHELVKDEIVDIEQWIRKKLPQ